MLSRVRQVIARHKLQRMVERNRQSFEVQDFAKRRQAMLKHTRGVA